MSNFNTTTLTSLVKEIKLQTSTALTEAALLQVAQTAILVNPTATPASLKASIVKQLSDEATKAAKAAARAAAKAEKEAATKPKSLEELQAIFAAEDKPAFVHVKQLKNGGIQVLETEQNVIAVLQKYGIELKFNEMTKDVDAFKDGKILQGEDLQNFQFSQLQDFCQIEGMPVQNLANKLALIAHKNSYHPAVEWILSKAWDGVDRVPALLNSIKTTESQQYKNMVFRMWLDTAVSVLKFAGFSTQVVMTLQGVGGIGKTQFFKKLAPTELLKEGFHLDPKDRDSIKQATTSWLVELGELDGMVGKEQAALKAFITNSYVEIRRAYAKFESKYRKQTAYFGTVNKANFLVDLTGNRRIATLNVVAFDLPEAIKNDENHSFMQQVWAQLWAQVGDTLKDCRAYPTQEQIAMINKNNEKYLVIDPVADGVAYKLDWSADKSLWTLRSMTQVAEELELTVVNHATLGKLGDILAGRGCAVKKTNKGNLRLVPPLVKDFGKGLVVYEDEEVQEEATATQQELTLTAASATTQLVAKVDVRELLEAEVIDTDEAEELAELELLAAQAAAELEAKRQAILAKMSRK